MTETEGMIYESASIHKSMFTDTEEFIEDIASIDESYDVQLTCKVEANGIRKQFLQSFLGSSFNFII